MNSVDAGSHKAGGSRACTSFLSLPNNYDGVFASGHEACRSFLRGRNNTSNNDWCSGTRGKTRRGGIVLSLAFCRARLFVTDNCHCSWTASSKACWLCLGRRLL